MNTSKLNELAAVRVMGWTIAHSDTDYDPGTDELWRDGEWLIDHKDRVWNPSTNIADAWRLVEALNKHSRNISISHSCCSDRWLVQLSAYRTSPGQFTLDSRGQAEHQSVCVAITIAALRAVGVSEGEINGL